MTWTSVLKKIDKRPAEIAAYCNVSERTVEGWWLGKTPSGPAQKLLKQMEEQHGHNHDNDTPGPGDGKISSGIPGRHSGGA